MVDLWVQHSWSSVWLTWISCTNYSNQIIHWGYIDFSRNYAWGCNRHPILKYSCQYSILCDYGLEKKSPISLRNIQQRKHDISYKHHLKTSLQLISKYNDQFKGPRLIPLTFVGPHLKPVITFIVSTFTWFSKIIPSLLVLASKDSTCAQTSKLKLHLTGFEAKEGETEKELVQRLNTKLLQGQMRLFTKVIVVARQRPTIMWASTSMVGVRLNVMLLKFVMNEDH